MKISPKYLILSILLFSGCGDDNFPTAFEKNESSQHKVLSNSSSSTVVNAYINESITYVSDSTTIDSNSTSDDQINLYGRVLNNGSKEIENSYVYLKFVVYADSTKQLQLYSNDHYINLIDLAPNTAVLYIKSYRINESDNYPGYFIDGPKIQLK